MTIVGFNFTKINVERKKITNDKLSIKRDLSIKNIKPKQIGLDGNKAALEADFNFNIDYLDEKKSKFANISLSCSLVFLNKKELIDEILLQYKKKKSIKPEILSYLLNYTFNKCNIQALLLSKEVSLPSHIQMPRLKVEKK